MLSELLVPPVVVLPKHLLLCGFPAVINGAASSLDLCTFLCGDGQRSYEHKIARVQSLSVPRHPDLAVHQPVGY